MATEDLIAAARRLSTACDALTFAKPVEYVYNPLNYAWPAHEQYLQLAGGTQKKIVFLGMNPGPFGMAQTGVPFATGSALMPPLESPSTSIPSVPLTDSPARVVR